MPSTRRINTNTQHWKTLAVSNLECSSNHHEQLPGGPRGPEGKAPTVGGGPDCCCVGRGWRIIGPRSTCDDDPNTGIVLGTSCWWRRGGWTAIPVDVITSTFTPCMSTTSKMKWCHPFSYAICAVLKTSRDCGSAVVKVLCYKSEGRWLDPSWCHWNFSST